MTDDDYERYAAACEAALRDGQADIAELLVLDRDVQLDRGLIVYAHEGVPCIEAEVLMIGSRGLRSGTWLWSWANASFGGGDAVARLRGLAAGMQREVYAANAPLPADEAEAWRLAAVACSLLEARGVVRIEANDSDWFFAVRALRHLRPADEIEAIAAAAVQRSLGEAGGAGLLNVLRRRFPAMRIDLIDADLRGRAEPWAHDLHVQSLVEQQHLQTEALRDLGRAAEADGGRFATHRRHDLAGANLAGARLDGAVLRGVSLRGAALDGASLVEADLAGADLAGASLRGAFLEGANLSRAYLADADLAGAELSRTLLAGVDLSAVRGLDDVHHLGPSEISMSTLVASGFAIDPAFLRAAGVSRGLIEDLMRGKRMGNAYQTCFLSYSSKDGEFASRLYASLTGAGVRLFWDHCDVIPGESLEAQIAQAIREHRRLLVVLSPNSMASDWVEREIRLAWSRRPESLLPVRLCDIDEVKRWTASKDGLPPIGELMPIQDFSQWRDEAAYEHAVGMLLTAIGGGVDLAPHR